MINGTTLKEIRIQTKRDFGNNCCGKCKYYNNKFVPWCKLWDGYPDPWFPPCFKYERKISWFNKFKKWFV
jgi:hypothetical protein